MKQAAGCDLEEDEDVYWSVDAKHYGVVTSNQIQSLNPLLVLKNPRKWLLDKVTQIVKSPNTEYLSKACYDWLEKKLTKEVVKATAGAGNAVQPDGDTDMEDVSRNPVPAAQRVHLFEEEADFMVTRIMRLWHYICVTYDPVLEALWKSWKQQQPSNDDKEYKIIIRIQASARTRMYVTMIEVGKSPTLVDQTNHIMARFTKTVYIFTLYKPVCFNNIYLFSSVWWSL